MNNSPSTSIEHPNPSRIVSLRDLLQQDSSDEASPQGPAQPGLAQDVYGIVINYQTLEMTADAVLSFKQFYPDVRVLVIDNGSTDNSAELLKAALQNYSDSIDMLLLEKNIFHGPAMHLALSSVENEFIYIFDSDTVTHRGGFLEDMLRLCTDDARVYAVGQLQTLNKRGFIAEEGIPMVRTPYFLLRRSYYHQLPPFVHHGMPTLNNFTAALKQGYTMEEFPIQHYVEHIGRGTASRFGYGLGISGKINYLLNRLRL